jgi:uncharacterized protein with GYD domain
MPKYLIHMSYSSASWARMIKNPGDRTTALSNIMESLGGSLDSIHWQLGAQDAVAIVDLPDSVTAAALTTVIVKTGAFKNVDSHELLTQEQLLEVLALARGSADVFEVPGETDEFEPVELRSVP